MLKWRPRRKWAGIVVGPGCLLAVREWDDSDDADAVGWTTLYEWPRPGSGVGWTFREVRRLQHKGVPRAFTDPGDGRQPQLLVSCVTEWGVGTVDIFSGAVCGNVCDDRLRIIPTHVAARANKVAVGDHTCGAGDVWMFGADGAGWSLLWRIRAGTFQNIGEDALALNFTLDGSGLAISAAWTIRVCDVSDGEELPGEEVEDVSTLDVRAILPHEGGGWLVCQDSGRCSSLQHLTGDGGGRPFFIHEVTYHGDGDGERIFDAQVLPGLGLLLARGHPLTHYNHKLDQGFLELYATPDAVAQAAMSHLRVAWMAVVARGVLDRARLRGVGVGVAARKAGQRSQRRRVK